MNRMHIRRRDINSVCVIQTMWREMWLYRGNGCKSAWYIY